MDTKFKYINKMNGNEKRAWIVAGGFWIISLTYFILQMI
jgi:hypothetical protein